MRIVKIEVPVYRYAELSDSAKEAAKGNILSITRNAQDFTDSVKHTLDVLGVEESEVYYSLGNCQGDGLCFTGRITWNKAMEISYIKNSVDKLDKVFVACCEDCVYSINFYKFNRMYNYCHTVTVEFEDSSWMHSVDFTKLKDIFLNWYEALCAKFEKQGYKWFYEISEEDVAEYCNNNDIEFTADGNVFIEPT